MNSCLRSMYGLVELAVLEPPSLPGRVGLMKRISFRRSRSLYITGLLYSASPAVSIVGSGWWSKAAHRSQHTVHAIHGVD